MLRVPRIKGAAVGVQFDFANQDKLVVGFHHLNAARQQVRKEPAHGVLFRGRVLGSQRVHRQLPGLVRLRIVAIDGGACRGCCLGLSLW